MKTNDKIIAVGGVALIIILAVMAIILLVNRNSITDSDLNVSIDETVPVVIENIDEESTSVKNESDDINFKSEAKDYSEVTKEKEKTVSVSYAKYEKSVLKSIKNNDKQMQELYGYWDMYHMEAVSDLINLPRVKELTNTLKGTNEFYYYGELDDNKKPNGKGLAIYADNTYYFGEWKAGLREGEGMWLQIFPDKTGTVGSNTGVTEHQYYGTWKNDLPNGEGQEHYSYIANKISGDFAMANAIGGFKDGYYDGEIYLVTIDRYGNTYDWYANADTGVFDMIEDKTSTTYKHPYWKKGNNNDHSTDESDNGYFWLLEEENKDWGIYGMMK